MSQDEPFAPTEDLSSGLLRPGEILGERYRIGEQLGRGGMGEVWRAFDLKLRVEVALKAMREDLFRDEKRRDLLRQEVRAAREVVSPNVCRIFDLIEADGRELVSMEYVDGGTLLDVLQERGPLDLKEAQDIASQFLAGLEAIHAAGLIHRDVKPENIMLTRAGRVVLMDFGLARQEDSGAGTVSGTPAYMAPEQAAGLTVDARADVYSAGVVLAEMVSPEGIKSFESRQSVWEGIRSEPAKVPDTPWAPVLKKAVAKQPDQRYRSAHTLTRALEDVTLRVEGAEDLTPYPGLASFTESDAEYFFGREAEVEVLWRRLDRPRLLAVVGPSGAGKTSFLRAGLIPSAEAGWGILRCTPGSTPFTALAQALALDMAGDVEAIELLARGHEPDAVVSLAAHWRRRYDHALLIVDQFEELFTLVTEEEQRRFSGLVGRLAIEADAFVLLSMRDDFLLRCREHGALAPIFTDLTALLPPTGPDLRRAVVQPATTCGYRFEDDELVDEMLAEVEGERGALPLLAFALARLWERRDRHNGLLTRQGYGEIGGVAGALALHAEDTIDRIGSAHVAIVREIFRNLVTAEGTRAVRTWHELVSVFEEGQREFADAVLHSLIDARLLTSYEVQEEESQPTRRVEIIHESLLVSWPRLVRWQTQDAEGAQLRDELRQAARAWHEYGRPDDRLWTGTALREFQLWRERYPGGLTEVEEAFAAAMTSLATRRRRRRRLAVAAAFVALLAVLAVIGGFWRRSADEARRAEAANLCSLARLQHEDDPTAILAHAIASLELADLVQARSLALEALWRGPIRFVLPKPSPYSISFSPDGRWLLTTDPEEVGLLWPSDGGAPTALEHRPTSGECRISPSNDVIVCTLDQSQNLGLWSLPDGRFLRTIPLGGTFTQIFSFSPDGARVITSTEGERAAIVEVVIRSWPVRGGEPTRIARLEVPDEDLGTFYGVDPTETLLAWVEGPNFKIKPLDIPEGDATPPTALAHEHPLRAGYFHSSGRRLATSDHLGGIKVWTLDQDPPLLIRNIRGTGTHNYWSLRFDPTGSMLGSAQGVLVDLDAPLEAAYLRLTGPGTKGYGVAFHPDGGWLACGGLGVVSLWPLGRSYPADLQGHEEPVRQVSFTPDGRSLVSMSRDGSVRLWPLDPASGERPTTLFQPEGTWGGAYVWAMPADGSFLAVGTYNSRVSLLPLDGGPSRELSGFTDVISAVAVNQGGNLVAAGSGPNSRVEAHVRIWDLVSGETFIADAGDGEPIFALEFTPDGELWAESGNMIRRWYLKDGEPRVVEEIDWTGFGIHGPYFDYLDLKRRDLLYSDDGTLRIRNLDTGHTRELTSHGQCRWGEFRANGELVVSVDTQGRAQIGPVTGESPHLLCGRADGMIDVSPDRRWVASGGPDSTVRLWPMPDLSKPPLHTLPREELLATLRSLTNLRAVEDPDSPSGWTIDLGPFPGWETVPTW